MAHTVYEKGDLVLYIDQDDKNCYGIVINETTALFVREPRFVTSSLEFFRGDLNTLTPLTVISESQIQTTFGFPIQKALNGILFASGIKKLFSPDKVSPH